MSRGALRPAPAIQRDQPRRFRVAFIDDARMAAPRLQAIEEPCQQDCAGAVHPIDLREVHIDRTAPNQTRLGVCDRLHNRHRVGQVERTRRDHTRAVTVSIGSDVDAHHADLPGFRSTEQHRTLGSGMSPSALMRLTPLRAYTVGGPLNQVHIGHR